MKNENVCKYRLADGSHEEGFFNIYQNINGSIFLSMMGNTILLTLPQIKKLNIPIQSLEKFAAKDFIKFYGLDLLSPNLMTIL